MDNQQNQKAEDNREKFAKVAFPTEMRAAEADLINQSREKRLGTPALENGDYPNDCVGVALSGGGIRSATFALGFFQGLARLKLLPRIDYLSTVSGGGFFGSFYTRLFTRKEVSGIDFVGQVLDPDPEPQPGSTEQHGMTPPRIFAWLRENGRYLSPNGSGDLLLGGAVLLRNLLAIHIVLGVFFFAQFLLGEGLRSLAVRLPWPELCQTFDTGMVTSWPFELTIWWSPYVLLTLVMLLLWAVPCGAAYWLVEHPNKRLPRLNLAKQIFQGAGISVLLAIAVGSVILLCWSSDTSHVVTLRLIGLCGLLITIVILYISRRAIIDRLPLWVSLTIAVGSAMLLFWPSNTSHVVTLRLIGLCGLLITIVTLSLLASSQIVASIRIKDEKAENLSPSDKELFRDNWARHWLSVKLKVALVGVAAVLLFGVVDSVGQTLYLLMKQDIEIAKWGGSAWAALLALTPFVTRIAKALGWSESDARPRGLSNVLLGVAATILAGFLLVSFNLGAHAVAWGLQLPNVQITDPCATNGEQTQVSKPEKTGGMQEITDEPVEKSCDTENPVDNRNGPLWPVLILAISISFLWGRIWAFIHRSSHLPLYSDRLIRSYLGASNPVRHDGPEGAVTRVRLGDDIPTHHYWPWPSPHEPEEAAADESELVKAQKAQPPYDKGAPLHFINITINETIDGQSQVQQQDRKGVGMSLGPAGISAGVRHHVVFYNKPQTNENNQTEQKPESSQRKKLTKIYPEATEEQKKQQKKAFISMFGKGDKFSGEQLSIGQWLAISGAAFSTGLGSRTSLGLSLLTGMANIRLGYWWDSRIERKKEQDKKEQDKKEQDKKERGKISLGDWLETFLHDTFPVQAYLLDEFTSRFPGCARRHWNLSDGGHFENMGAYELIRRRVPVMVIVDAEADPDYTFSGLANLIRKARLDFGAEITFLDEKGLEALFGRKRKHFFGTLADLRRGRRIEEKRPAGRWPWRKKNGLGLDTPDQHGFSSAHGAIARIHYHGSTPQPNDGWLIYVKPTLVGEESADLLQYHGDNPSFPQEPTIDQFFDEAQWESYRKLGEHIATKLLKRNLIKICKKIEVVQR